MKKNLFFMMICFSTQIIASEHCEDNDSDSNQGSGLVKIENIRSKLNELTLVDPDNYICSAPLQGSLFLGSSQPNRVQGSAEYSSFSCYDSMTQENLPYQVGLWGQQSTFGATKEIGKNKKKQGPLDWDACPGSAGARMSSFKSKFCNSTWSKDFSDKSLGSPLVNRPTGYPAVTLNGKGQYVMSFSEVQRFASQHKKSA